MKRWFLIILILCIYSITITDSPKPVKAYHNLSNFDFKSEYQLSNLDGILDELQIESYKAYVEYLALNIGPRPFGSSENEVTTKWILQSLSNITELTNQSIPKWVIGTYRSVLAKLPASIESSDQAIVFSAHFDTVAGSPGADDDGSGVAYLLFLASVLSRLKLDIPFDIYFAFCNAEEIGLLGSEEIVQWIRIQQIDILININADMILYGNPVLHYQNSGMHYGEYFAKSIASMSHNFNFGLVESNSAGSGWGRSDHASFYSAGHPAITAFEADISSNPYYHSGEDLPDSEGYNYTNAIALTQATILALMDWSYAFSKGNDFHYYNFKVNSTQSFEVIVPSNQYASKMEFSCLESPNCELLIEHLGSGAITGLQSDNYNQWEIFNVTVGSFLFKSTENLLVEVILGEDKENDNFIDYIVKELFKIYYEPVDLQEINDDYLK
ncbi:MAG: M28 family metallopeptidase [Candidatus Hodarchaeales archaeon]|jgi:hypothetical protein